MTAAQQVERPNSSKRAHFVEHRRASLLKKAFNGIKRRGGQFPENAESESLSDGGVDLIKHSISSRAFHPSGTAFGE